MPQSDPQLTSQTPHAPTLPSTQTIAQADVDVNILPYKTKIEPSARVGAKNAARPVNAIEDSINRTIAQNNEGVNYGIPGIMLPRAEMGLTLPTYTEVLQMRKSLDRMKEKGGATDGRQQQERYARGPRTGVGSELSRGRGRWDGDDARIFEQRRIRSGDQGDRRPELPARAGSTDAESHRADRQRAEETRHYTQIGKRGYEYQEVKAESAAANAKRRWITGGAWA